MSEHTAEKFWKALTKDVKKRIWFKYYRGIDDFVIDAVRRSIEEWEQCALAYEAGKESDVKVNARARPPYQRLKSGKQKARA